MELMKVKGPLNLDAPVDPHFVHELQKRTAQLLSAIEDVGRGLVTREELEKLSKELFRT